MKTLVVAIITTLLGGCATGMPIDTRPQVNQEKPFESKYKSRVRLSAGRPAVSLGAPQVVQGE